MCYNNINMKLQPLTLPKEKAEKEYKNFLMWGYIIAAIGLFVFGVVGAVVGLACGVRCLVLTYNPHLKNQKDISKKRLLVYGLILLGVIDSIVYFI